MSKNLRFEASWSLLERSFVGDLYEVGRLSMVVLQAKSEQAVTNIAGAAVMTQRSGSELPGYRCGLWRSFSSA